MDYELEKRIREQAAVLVEKQPVKNQLKYHFNDLKYYLDMLYITKSNFKPQEKYFIWKANKALGILGAKLTAYDDEYQIEENQFNHFFTDVVDAEFFDAEFHDFILALKPEIKEKDGQNA